MSRRHDTHELGSALVAAIAVMVLCAIVVSAFFTMLDRSGERERSRTARAAAVAVIDEALTSYEYALESLLTDESRGFLLDQQAMQQLAQTEATNQVVANSSFGASFKAQGLDRTWMPGATYGWSMRTQLEDGRTGWWQPVAVIPPAGSSPHLVLYIRTWLATGGANPTLATEPRIIRADMRPGRFSDYQMLVDGPLVVGSGATFNGRVHTNGYPDAYLVDQFTKPGTPLVISSSSPPQCGPGSGFSTASGTIQNKGGCISVAGGNPTYEENNGRRIDLLRGSNHLTMLDKMCGSRVVCPAGSGPWTITLNGSSATFSSPAGGTTVSSAGGAVVFLRGRAQMSGQLTSGSMTIGIGNAPGFNAFGSASLSLVGNGMVGASVPGSILGLVVEGDIIPRFDEGSCPTGLTAAVVSASGALTIPPQYRVPTPPAGTLPTCGTFRFTGSLGSHYMPVMFLEWSTGTKVGYVGGRVYQFDKRLLSQPPPMFPTTGPWQVSTWKDADPACLAASSAKSAECG